jgi:hypothetical protein
MTLLFWFTLALVSAPAVALAAPQIPEDFRGTWCVDRELTAGVASGPCSELSGANFEAEITATNVSIPDIPLSCVVRHVTKFDVCPWGMIFKNRKRALAFSNKPVESRLSHRIPMHTLHSPDGRLAEARLSVR